MAEKKQRPPPPEGFRPVQSRPDSSASPAGFKPVRESPALAGGDPDGFPPPELDTTDPNTVIKGRKSAHYGPMDDLWTTVKGVPGDLLAIPDVGLSMITSGAGVIGGGFIAALIGGANGNESANRFLEFVQSGMYQPKSKSGQAAMEAIAFPFMQYDRLADWTATELSMGNPYAETAIYTAMVAIPEVLLGGKGSLSARQSAKAFREAYLDIKHRAKGLGIDPRMDNIQQSVIDAAKNIVPGRRAENIPQLKQAVQKENIYARARKNAAYENALNRRTYVNSRDVGQFSLGVRQELGNKYLLVDEMKSVQAALKELDDIGAYPVGSRIRLREWEKTRQKINKASGDASELSALRFMRRRMDDWLNSEFNSIALQQGQRMIPTGQGAISGDVLGVNAFIEARGLNKIWKEQFNADKVIADLISREASPTDFRQWLQGASAMGGRREAVQTLNRLRDILGDNHPAIEGIRQDFLFELAMPLLESKGTPRARLEAFTTLYDRTVLRQPDMVEALGLSDTQLHGLYDFAMVAKKVPDNAWTGGHLRSLAPGSWQKRLNQSLSQFFLGHQIARGQLRVRLGRDLGALVTGVDRVSARQILQEVTGVSFDIPIVPAKGPVAGRFIAAASLSELGFEGDDVNMFDIVADKLEETVMNWAEQELAQEEQ
jgi:hypothetical protein